jgi:hypothetical protein
MKRIIIIVVAVSLAASGTTAQSASSRAWQQRLDVEIPLPIPMVELESINPFTANVDEPAVVLGSTAPRKVDVRGIATVAAFVDAKGECLGAVPLKLPMPGLTSSLVQELTGSRFDAATAGNSSRPSWVVLEIVMEGRVKEATVVDQVLEMPDPEVPPVPSKPVAMTPPGNLRNLKATPHDQLTTLATPRRIRVKAAGREDEIHLRALVHITEEGRCDRFVPLDLFDGLNPWVSAYLATWRVQPATVDGAAKATWLVYSARVRMKLSGLDSTTFRVIRDREYSPVQ